MKKRQYRHKTVLITGAAGGLGRALSRRFLMAGARVIGLDLDTAALAAIQAKQAAQGRPFYGYPCDVGNRKKLANTLRSILLTHGDVDLLINNAGISHRSAFEKTDLSVIEKVMQINYFGSVNCCQFLLPGLLRRKGQIIVISSVAGFAPLIGRSGYAASKYALHGFFESLRSEVKSRGLGIMMVCPSFIETGINRNALGGDGKPAGHDRLTIGAGLQPDDVADKIFRAASVNKRQLNIGKTARLAWLVSRIAPRYYERRMIRTLGGEVEGR